MNPKTMKMVLGTLGVAIVVSGAAAMGGTAGSNLVAAAGGAFDEFGYNDTAHVFNGTGESWCLAGGQPASCMGDYSADKLIMKWNEAWDACNDAGNDDEAACKGAWINNEWNGKRGGSGAVWHYKIIWVGSEGPNSPYWQPGGYSVWGNYEVLMDQGMDPSYGPGHLWFAHAKPNGYGVR